MTQQEVSPENVPNRGIQVGKKQEAPKEVAAKHNIPEEAVKTFNPPTDIVFLPSKGLIYSKESSLYKAESIEVKQMTAAEEDILTSRFLLRTGKAIDMLIKNCIMDKSIDPGDLLSGDKDAIMIGLRIGAYGKEYLVDIECPECNETQKNFEIDLTSLKVKELDESKIAQEGMNKFEISLPSGNNVAVKILSSREEKEVSDENDNLKKHIQTKVDRLISIRHQKQIIELNGDTDRTKILQFVKTMPAKDSRALNKFLEDIRPEIKMESNFECVSCGYTGREVIQITQNFFWPD